MARNGHWERVEPHLYRLKHQTPTGECTTRYYVRFKDWKGVSRSFPAGTDLRGARSKKKIVFGENERRVDFDKEKTKEITLLQWGQEYLKKYAKEKKSLRDEVRHIQHLCRIIGGNRLLSQISLDQVERFKVERKTEMHRGKPVSETTIDRSLEVLRHMLRVAKEQGIIDEMPRVALYRPDNSRDRVLSEEEYQRILAVAPLYLRHVMICGYETGMRAGEIAKLTWDKVDGKAGVIRLPAEDTKTNRKRVIPISPTLSDVLEDIRSEQREGKVVSISGHVFLQKGRPFGRHGWYKSWLTTCRKTGLDDVNFHDLRHTFVTRKVREGWDYKRIMAITGHKTFATFQRYNNPSEEDIKEVVSGERSKQIAK